VGQGEKWEFRESRSVKSAWVWRAFFMLSLVAIGIVFIMIGNHHTTLAAFWGVIAAGWFATSMWLWRQHSRYMKS
jgi:hypothetical protein